MEDPGTMEDTNSGNTWEMIAEVIKGQDYTQRLRVDTGYLYRTTVIAGATTRASGQIAVAMAFVPDRATP